MSPPAADMPNAIEPKTRPVFDRPAKNATMLTPKPMFTAILIAKKLIRSKISPNTGLMATRATAGTATTKNATLLGFASMPYLGLPRYSVRSGTVTRLAKPTNIHDAIVEASTRSCANRRNESLSRRRRSSGIGSDSSRNTNTADTNIATAAPTNTTRYDAR